jgi:adenylate cyclase
MAKIRISLFGSPTIFAGEDRHQHSSRKTMALLAYLAMRAGEPVTRGHLSDLLWADSAEEQARTNLRQSLSLLRKLFSNAGHDPIMVPFDQVLLRPEDIEIDAHAFLQGDHDYDLADLASGPSFLEGFSVSAANFESWMNTQRYSIETRLCEQLELTANEMRQAGDLTKAVSNLALVLKLDPLREATHRNQMAILAALGRTDAALAQYEACCNILRNDLQIQPDAKTRELAAEIRALRVRPQPVDESTSAFDRYPTQIPAIVFHKPASVRRADLATQLTFPDCEAALHGALEVTRQAADPSTLVIVVTPDMGQEPDQPSVAEKLLQQAQPGEIFVDRRVFEQFDNWSPFSFEPVANTENHEVIYRLISEMPRHRLQVSPSKARPSVRIEDEFSLAVLPFQDFSPNASDFALGDVLAHEITGRLSRFRRLTVAAPSAAQTCRAFHLREDQIHDTLGVNYLIDGSVHRSGNQLKVNISLTDLRDKTLVYGDRFEGSFERLFDYEGKLVDRIATSIVRNTETAEFERAQRVPTLDMGAYEWYLRGLAAHRRAGISPQNARDAFSHFSEAINMDPDFARALAWRICSVGWYAPEYFVSPGLKEIHHALSIDEHDAEVQRIAGALHLYRGDYDEGITHIERAVALNSSDAYLLAASAVYWAYYGQPENGLKHIVRAMQLDPFLPVWCVEDHGVVLYSMDDFSGAIDSLQRLSFPTPRGLSYLSASQAAAGDIEGARKSVERIRHISRNYSVDELMMTNYYRRNSDREALRTRLIQAGLA